MFENYSMFTLEQIKAIHTKEGLDFSDLTTIGDGIRVIDKDIIHTWIELDNVVLTGQDLLNIIEDANDLYADTILPVDYDGAVSKMELQYDSNSFSGLTYIGYNVERPTTMKDILLKEIKNLRRRKDITIQEVFDHLNCFYLIVKGAN